MLHVHLEINLTTINFQNIVILRLILSMEIKILQLEVEDYIPQT